MATNRSDLVPKKNKRKRKNPPPPVDSVKVKTIQYYNFGIASWM